MLDRGLARMRQVIDNSVIVSWAKKNLMAVILLLLIATPFVCVAIMEFFKRMFPNWFDTSQWGALLSGLWAYIGTSLLGFLAFWQNIRQKKENDASQRRLLTIEENSVMPALETRVQSISCSRYIGGDGFQIKICIRNVGFGVAIDLEVYNVAFFKECNPSIEDMRLIHDAGLERLGSLIAGESKTCEKTLSDGAELEWVNATYYTISFEVRYKSILGVEYRDYVKATVQPTAIDTPVVATVVEHKKEMGLK